MRQHLLLAVALLCAAFAAHAGQHRNGDGSVSDDVLIQNGGQLIGPTNPLPVGLPDLRATGTLSAATLNAAYTVALGSGQGVVGLRVSGLTGSGATLVPEASNDGGVTWSVINALIPSTPNLVQALTLDQQCRLNAGGHTHVRLRVSVAGSGTLSITSTASIGDPLVALSASLPAGSNVIGSVQTPIPATIVTGQVKVATTGTAVQLPSNTLLNGVVIKARTTNAANGFVGPAGVSTTYDGTGNGFPLEAGSQVSFSTNNTGNLWVNGTAGDVYAYEGN